MIWHDANVDSDFLVLPQTISMYYAILAQLIIKLIDESIARGLFSDQLIRNAIKKSIEIKTVPRRFMPRRRKRK